MANLFARALQALQQKQDDDEEKKRLVDALQKPIFHQDEFTSRENPVVGALARIRDIASDPAKEIGRLRVAPNRPSVGEAVAQVSAEAPQKFGDLMSGKGTALEQ